MLLQAKIGLVGPSGDFPAVVTTATTEDATVATSHSVNLPSSIVSGDLLLIFFRFNTACNATITGWTRFSSVANTVQWAAFSRLADGSEGATVTVATDVGVSIRANAYRVNKQGSNTPEVATATGTSAAPDAPSLSPSWGAGNTLWIAGMASNSTWTTDPANYTNGQSTASPLCRTCERDLIATSENPAAFATSASAAWVAATVAIKGT
jgi:hypothetical protein